MKKFISAALAVIIMLSLCSCSAKKEIALVISGAEIGSEVFTYFLDKVIQRPEDYNLTVDASKKEIKQTQENLQIRCTLLTKCAILF